MGLLDNDGYFTRAEKRSMQSRALVPIGLFVFVIGIAAGVWWVWAFGAICFITGATVTYKAFKARQGAKQIARDEAEIREYNLRQARGQI